MFSSFTGSFAQIDRKKPPKADPPPAINISKPEAFRLKNGLTVLCVEDHKYPIVRLSLTFDRDPLSQGDKAGIKDIFGEMLRAGTKKYTKEQFDEEIDQMGTSLLPSFSRIYLSSLKRYFVPSLALMSEMVLEPRFDNIQEFKKLIKRSLTELEVSEKNPAAVSSRVQNKLYYGNHPYGEYASAESLKNIQLKDFRAFYEKYFGPEKAYMTFVGDITKEEAYKLAEEYFSNWKARPISSKKYQVPSPPSEIEIDMVDVPSSTQAVISVGGPVDFKKSSPDYFSASLANRILGGGVQGRLFLNLREDKGYTYGAYSSLTSDKGIGSFQAYAQVRTEVAAPAVEEFLKEIRRIKETIGEKELTSFKNKMSGNFVLSLEDPQSAARFIVEEFTESLPENFYQNYLKSIQSVTASEVIQAAKKNIPEHVRVLVVGDLQKIIPSIKKMGYPVRLFDKFGRPL